MRPTIRPVIKEFKRIDISIIINAAALRQLWQFYEDIAALNKLQRFWSFNIECPAKRQFYLVIQYRSPVHRVVPADRPRRTFRRHLYSKAEYTVDQMVAIMAKSGWKIDAKDDTPAFWCLRER